MQSISNGNLLEIIDLAHSLRQEHLFIVNEQNTFHNLTETLNRNSSNVAQVGSTATSSLDTRQITFNHFFWLLLVFPVGLDMLAAASEFEHIDCGASGHGPVRMLSQSKHIGEHAVRGGAQGQRAQVPTRARLQ